MPELVRIDITNYRFAIGGEHYYGSLKVPSKATINEDGRATWSSSTPRHPMDGYELRRVLTDEVEVEYLRAKDQDDIWEVGFSTIRFNSKDQIIEEAKRVFAENFGPDDILCIKKSQKVTDSYGSYWEDYDHILVGPEDFVQVYNALAKTDIQLKRDALIKAGYTTY